MVTMSTAISAEMSTAIREFGAGVETRGRALGSSVRRWFGSVGVSESSRSRIAREIYTSPTQLLNWAVSALGASVPFSGPGARDPGTDTSDPTTDFVIVDRLLTHC
jgi:hypothetical protein